MKFFKHSVLFVLGFFLIAGTAFAQGQKMKQKKQQKQKNIDVSKQELKQFASIAKKKQKVQRSFMKDVQSMLSDKGMSMKRFQQITMSKRNPKAPDSLKPTKKEQKMMKEIQPKMQKKQKKAKKKIQSAIKESGLSQKRYQAIGQAMRSDKDLAMRYQKMMQKNSKSR